MEGKLHTYHPGRKLLLFEHTPQPSASASPSTSTSSPTSTPPTATLLFIGGMYDNFLVPAYTAQLAHLFPRHATQRWAVMHVQLSSAGKSFGSSDLDRDIDEIATAITFIRDLRRTGEPASDSHPVVIMGHSTGCQDVLHYLSAPNPNPSPITNKPLAIRPAVQGAILQAPVSDREAAMHAIKTSNLHSHLSAALELCRTTPTTSHRDTYIPLTHTRPIFGPAPQTISRFLSLYSPDSPDKPGPDDLFSSDLPDARLRSTWGAIATNELLTTRGVLVLMSEGDADTTPTCSQEALLARWREAMTGSLSAGRAAEMAVAVHRSSGVVRNAVHDVSGDDEACVAARVDLLGRVLDYIEEAVGGVDPDAWYLLKGDKDGDEAGSRGQNKGVGGLEKGVSDVKL